MKAEKADKADKAAAKQTSRQAGGKAKSKGGSKIRTPTKGGGKLPDPDSDFSSSVSPPPTLVTFHLLLIDSPTP